MRINGETNSGTQPNTVSNEWQEFMDDPTGVDNRTTWENIKEKADEDRVIEEDLVWLVNTERQNQNTIETPVSEKPAPVLQEEETVAGETDKTESVITRYLQGSDEANKYFRDKSFVTFPTNQDNWNAVKRENVFEALDELVGNGIDGNDDKGIFAADQLIGKIISKDSGFSEEEQKKALAIKETPEYKMKKLVSEIHHTESRLVKRREDVKRCEQIIPTIRQNTKGIIEGFRKTQQVKEQLKSAQKDVADLEEDLQKLKIQQDAELAA